MKSYRQTTANTFEIDSSQLPWHRTVKYIGTRRKADDMGWAGADLFHGRGDGRGRIGL